MDALTAAVTVHVQEEHAGTRIATKDDIASGPAMRQTLRTRVRGVCSEWRFGLGLIVGGVLSALFFDRLFDYLIGQEHAAQTSEVTLSSNVPS